MGRGADFKSSFAYKGFVIFCSRVPSRTSVGFAAHAAVGLRAAKTTTADGITTEARYWIDDMFMITALQVQAFRATGETKYLDRAALTMSAYLDSLQQTNGLFYHGTNAPFFWSRGNGWVAAGMTELLRSLPANHPQRPRILGGYQK